MITHCGAKQNKCNQRDYASSHASNLRTHLKAHSGEKSNKCDQCDFAYWLRTHLKTHSGENSNVRRAIVLQPYQAGRTAISCCNCLDISADSVVRCQRSQFKCVQNHPSFVLGATVALRDTESGSVILTTLTSPSCPPAPLFSFALQCLTFINKSGPQKRY